MNVDEILSYTKPKDTYYTILGCDQASSTEQIIKEYKIRALRLHPDKNSNSEALDKFKSLQEAKDVLSDESSRRSYDHWLNSGICVPFEQWINRKSHSMMHWANPKSSKLSIKEDSSSGQGSDTKLKNEAPSINLLEKFRRYEV